MSRFAQYVRQPFSGAAAAVALAAGMAAAPAQAQFRNQVPPIPQFHKTCVAFNNHVVRPDQRYDVPLNMLVERLKAYSGWADIQNRMKAAGQDYQGLCPSLRTPPPVSPFPQAKGFAVNVLDTDTRDGVEPKKFIQLVDSGALDNILAATIAQATSISFAIENDPLFNDEQDINTRILLATVLQTYVETESLFAAIESAVEDKYTNVLRVLYDSNPTLVGEISDLHAQAIIAHAQKRSLNENERAQFRSMILTLNLQDPQKRMAAASGLGESIIKSVMPPMLEALANNRPVAAPVFKPFDDQDVARKLARFPGNVTNVDAVKTYKAYWEAQRAQDKDPAAAVEKVIQNLPEMARESLKQQRSAPQIPGFRFLTPNS